MAIKIEIHQLAHIAQILNRMRDRLRALRRELPEGYIRAEILDIEEIKAIFNSEFKNINTEMRREDDMVG